ncbi:MAG: SPOR domain-containing protein [Bacteroidaceae bacterium]|nr:SPOR domain-containing protein [Bacteroidaceae bacterium]
MRKRIFFVFLLVISSVSAFSQTLEDDLRTERAGQGHVMLRIPDDVLKAIKTEMFEEEKEEKEKTDADRLAEARKFRDATNKVRVRGYRVLVYSGGNNRAEKQKAQQAGEQMKRLFPAYPVYVHFESPRWVCRVGNFTDKAEANSLLSRVKSAGYRSAVVTEDVVLIAK